MLTPDKTPWKERLAGAGRGDQSLEWDAEMWCTGPVGERLGFPAGIGNWALGDIIRRHSPGLHEDGCLFYRAIRNGHYRKAEDILKRIEAYDVSAILRAVRSQMRRRSAKSRRLGAPAPQGGRRPNHSKGG